MTMDQNWTPPAPPNVPVAQPAKKQPGIVGIIIGIVLIVIGPIVIGIVAITSTSGIATATTFVSDSAPAIVSLSSGDETGIWIEHSGTGYCQVLDPMMLPVPMNTSGFVSQSVNEWDLAAIFVPDADGMYTVICSSSDITPFHFKIASTIQATGLAMGIIIGIIILIVGIPVGLVILILTVVRRSTWKKNNPTQSAMSYPTPAPTWQPPQPPQPGQPVAQPQYGSTQQPAYGPPAPQPAYGPPARPEVPQPQQYGTPPQQYGQQPTQPPQYEPQPGQIPPAGPQFQPPAYEPQPSPFAPPQ